MLRADAATFRLSLRTFRRFRGRFRRGGPFGPLRRVLPDDSARLARVASVVVAWAIHARRGGAQAPGKRRNEVALRVASIRRRRAFATGTPFAASGVDASPRALCFSPRPADVRPAH